MNKDEEFDLETIEKELKDLGIDLETADLGHCPHVSKELLLALTQVKKTCEETKKTIKEIEAYSRRAKAELEKANQELKVERAKRDSLLAELIKKDKLN